MDDLFTFDHRLALRVRLPARPGPRTPVLVSVHGISRNSEEHLSFMAAALPGDWAVIAPHFDEARHPHFQQLGIGHDETRADFALDAALARLEAETGLGTGRFHLAGFSGGAQFAHRYAMLSPGRVRSLHLVAAGWYTFLDRDVPWPRGLGGAGPGAEIRRNRNWFLRLPIHVSVGSGDRERDPSLRTGRRVDGQQGRTRVARARAWTRHVGRLQEALGLNPATLALLPGIGHDFAEACRGGGLAARIAAAAGAGAGAGTGA